MWPDAPSTNVDVAAEEVRASGTRERHGTMWSSRDANTYAGDLDSREIDRLAQHRQRVAARAAGCPMYMFFR